jgi:transposase
MDLFIPARKGYPSDVSDEEWAFVAPYLALVREDTHQRHHDLLQVFNAARWVARHGAGRPMIPRRVIPLEYGRKSSAYLCDVDRRVSCGRRNQVLLIVVRVL